MQDGIVYGERIKWECPYCGVTFILNNNQKHFYYKGRRQLYCCKEHAHLGKRERRLTGRKGEYITSQGYKAIYCPKHPYSNKSGHILEHRLVIERIIGRYLEPEESVHHEDEDKLNNNPSNLRLFANEAEHRAYHAQLRKRDSKGRFIKGDS